MWKKFLKLVFETNPKTIHMKRVCKHRDKNREMMHKNHGNGYDESHEE
jgi:hypothetical protein